MKRTTYRLLSVLLTAVLLISMIPLTAFAATESYALYICGTQVTSDNASDVLGNGAFSYSSSTKTLTIRKSQTYSGQFLIRNALAGLKISVPANVYAD